MQRGKDPRVLPGDVYNLQSSLFPGWVWPERPRWSQAPFLPLEDLAHSSTVKYKGTKYISWHRLSPLNCSNNLTQKQNNTVIASDSNSWSSWDLKYPEKIVSLPLSLCLIDSFRKTLQVIANEEFLFSHVSSLWGRWDWVWRGKDLQIEEARVHRWHSADGRWPAAHRKQSGHFFFYQMLFTDNIDLMEESVCCSLTLAVCFAHLLSSLALRTNNCW